MMDTAQVETKTIPRLLNYGKYLIHYPVKTTGYVIIDSCCMLLHMTFFLSFLQIVHNSEFEAPKYDTESHMHKPYFWSPTTYINPDIENENGIFISKHTSF